ncbi:uncharacterized protein N7477_005555 [Penicillium maclennaniae]|uniref:uncharacterized protein n=1 Tax=Penicillium maclennaniae TaxID=1343394 RepID=UPI0025419026|nr:uncharacterized protein N7477_005555 [Penicillium maclennaniae]KAJ5670192.1 hypothetical protein N7477_005555 [Penicillium maclennaniae]
MQCPSSPSTFNPPDHPIALCRTHLLSPAPDRLTNTPTTLWITRDNTLSGRDFTVTQLRKDEPVGSPRRNPLLYTVTGKFWSNSFQREIRDASRRPILEVTPDLVEGPVVDMRWAIGTKMGIRFTNALVGRLDGVLTRSRNVRNEEDMESEAPPPYTPPPYSEVLAEASRHHSGSGNGSGNGSGGESDSSDSSATKARRHNFEPPTYDSVRRSSRSSHSLRDLLDAIEPPREPAPAPLSHQRRWSEGGINPNVELSVVQQTSRSAIVTMGERRIMQIRRDKVMDYNLSGSTPKWEVEIAEGVDLVLAVIIVLIMAEFVRHEYRVRVI